MMSLGLAPFVILFGQYIVADCVAKHLASTSVPTPLILSCMLLGSLLLAGLVLALWKISRGPSLRNVVSAILIGLLFATGSVGVYGGFSQASAQRLLQSSSVP